MELAQWSCPPTVAMPLARMVLLIAPLLAAAATLVPPLAKLVAVAPVLVVGAVHGPRRVPRGSRQPGATQSFHRLLRVACASVAAQRRR